MSALSAILALPYLQPSQAQKHVTHNEALRRLDALVLLSVGSRSLSVPPAAPDPGTRHIVGPAPSGAWAGQAGAVAVHDGTAWAFETPLPGWRCWIADEAAFTVYDGSDWRRPVPELDDLPGLGVNTVADATNRLAIAAPASLFSHEGAGHQVKVNKAAPGDTASLLFQTGWSGRAEIGTAGADSFAIKVSADGSAWVAALSADPATGTLTVPALTGDAVQQAPDDVTVGRLMRADYGYGPGNLVGSVALSGGVPAGAVIERGETADGDYVRFADGTQLCAGLIDLGNVVITTAVGALYRSGDIAGADFPAAFAAPPAVSATFYAVNDPQTFGTFSAQPTATALATCRLMNPTSQSPACRLSYVAFGRWA